MANSKPTKTTLDSEKRKSMPPRGRGKKSLMLEAIRNVCDSELEFLENVVSIGVGGLMVAGVDDDGEPIKEYKSPNPVLLNMVLNRIEPPLKATSPMIKFDFDPSKPIHEQAAQVVSAIASGVIPSDIGNNIVNSLTSMMKIQELTDFEERLKAIEDAGNQD